MSAPRPKGDPRDRTIDGDKPAVQPRVGSELTRDELTGKAAPQAAAPTHRAPAKRCGGCRRELAITDTFCPTCVPNGASRPTFGGANPPDPDSIRTLAMGLPVRR
jgi:hypothetical protein